MIAASLCIAFSLGWAAAMTTALVLDRLLCGRDTHPPATSPTVRHGDEEPTHDAGD